VLVKHGEFIDNAKKRESRGVKIHRDIEQGTPEWFALRAGRRRPPASPMCWPRARARCARRTCARSSPSA
jgi:hypothetical protein